MSTDDQDGVEEPQGEPAEVPAPAAELDDKAYLKKRAKKEAVSWAKETASGIASALAVLLFGLVLVQIGLAQEGQGFEFSAFAPLEFWESFRGLVIQWSEFNEWVLLGMGVLCALLTGVVFLRWRRKRAAALEPATAEDGPRLNRLEAKLSTLKVVGAFALLTTITFSAYLYQQYLWRVVLPIEEEAVGVAFSRQVGGSIASDQLADYLRQQGHEDIVQMRELPVRFDARDTEKARAMAKRIGADAVVIFRPPGADDSGESPLQAGLIPLAADSGDEEETSVAYIVFADPSVGVQIPVPQRSAEGETEGVEFRAKEGLETPRLEAADVGRLMEATAGILMYNEDRLLPAIAHLRNSLGDGEDPSDAIINFYLGNAYSLIDDEITAAPYLDKATALLEKNRLGIQDRLLLVAAYKGSAWIAFSDDRMEQARHLLQKALALREPIDKDQNALSDPTTYRRFHEIYAEVYLQLMDVNLALDDEAAADLWRTRASDEGDALVGRTDEAARLSSIFIDYRTGDCTTAYRNAQQLRVEDPQDTAAYQALLRLAFLRDHDFGSLETEINLDTLIRLDPDNIANLQSLMSHWSVLVGVEDPSFAVQDRKTADRILDLDPSNLGAISEIVQTGDFLVGQPFNDGTALVRPIGHEPTFAALQEQRRRDPAALRAMQAQVSQIEPYVVRWAEEIQPGSIKPLVYRASLSYEVASWYFNYVEVNPDLDPGFRPDPKIARRYEETFAQAAADGEEALASKRDGDPRDWLQLYEDLINLWAQRATMVREPSPERDQVMANIAAIAERAAAAVTDLAGSPDAVDQERRANDGLFVAYLTLRNYYANAGDQNAAARYGRLLTAVVTRDAQLSTEFKKDLQELVSDLKRRVCPEGERKTQAQELIATDPAKAVDLLQKYAEVFPTDPQGLIQLGWAQYLTGDLNAAATTTRRAQEVAPLHPHPPANLAVIAAGQGDVTAAQEHIAQMTTDLAQLPLGVQLNDIQGLGGDLLASARDREVSRPPVSAVIARLQTYLEGLPEAKRGLNGSMYVSALNNLAGAAIWAGDTDTARDLLDEAVDVWPQIAIVHENLMIAALADGDRDTALAEARKSGEAARSYLRDFYGTPLEGYELKTRRTLARNELVAGAQAVTLYVGQHPEVKEDATAVGAALNRALATLD
jgi:tetratricopeptide (TPR) repeat protein